MWKIFPQILRYYINSISRSHNASPNITFSTKLIIFRWVPAIFLWAPIFDWCQTKFRGHTRVPPEENPRVPVKFQRAPIFDGCPPTFRGHTRVPPEEIRWVPVKFQRAPIFDGFPTTFRGHTCVPLKEIRWVPAKFQREPILHACHLKKLVCALQHLVGTYHFSR